MRDPYKLAALAHAFDAAALTRRRADELFGLKVALVNKDTADEEALKERSKELSPGASPLEDMMAIFEEVLGNYGYEIAKKSSHDG